MPTLQGSLNNTEYSVVRVWLSDVPAVVLLHCGIDGKLCAHGSTQACNDTSCQDCGQAPYSYCVLWRTQTRAIAKALSYHYVNL